MLRYEGAGAGHEEEGKETAVTSLCSPQLLVQAAEWKLQAQTLREQGAVMQAQVNILRLRSHTRQGAKLPHSHLLQILVNALMSEVEASPLCEETCTQWKQAVTYAESYTLMCTSH